MDTMSRKKQSRQVRYAAADLAADRVTERHVNNAEEYEYRALGGKSSHFSSFTKGLAHDSKTGLLLNPIDYQLFVDGINEGDAATLKYIPLGPSVSQDVKDGCPSTPAINCDHPCNRAAIWQSEVAKCAEDGKGAKLRAWESQASGNLFDLQGPDAQTYTMPPAPRFDSDELAFEMAEVYEQALLRDVPLTELSKDIDVNSKVAKSLGRLTQQLGLPTPQTNEDYITRRKLNTLSNKTLFRGITKGDRVGPYLSQFLLIGNRGVSPGDEAREISDGRISYGALRINQKVRIATQGLDYMTTFKSWLDVQNGADLRNTEGSAGFENNEDFKGAPTKRTIGKGYRFISTPRDLATYVHYDQLYQAYLNSCLILFGLGAPFDPGLPFEASDTYDHQQGFASFGGPHLLSLLTEVSSRALKAVRFQKFNVHRRARPEVVAARIDRLANLQGTKPKKVLSPAKPIRDALLDIGTLNEISKHNKQLNKMKSRKRDHPESTCYLLPMAFPEGSPMHPSYGAGHATVAGACVTILKAFFDHGWQLQDSEKCPIAYVANSTGEKLDDYNLGKNEVLTVEGELNKLVSNISIARNWAGVHYYSDYLESIRLGEKIALGILEEQKLCYKENFSMTVPLFDGGAVQI